MSYIDALCTGVGRVWGRGTAELAWFVCLCLGITQSPALQVTLPAKAPGLLLLLLLLLRLVFFAPSVDVNSHPRLNAY